MPLTWDEVEELADDGDPESVRFEAPQALERIEEKGDLFAPVLELKQKLPKA
jgi:bifunctional non-homologous end joining protein LigD